MSSLAFDFIYYEPMSTEDRQSCAGVVDPVYIDHHGRSAVLQAVNPTFNKCHS